MLGVSSNIISGITSSHLLEKSTLQTSPLLLSLTPSFKLKRLSKTEDTSDVWKGYPTPDVTSLSKAFKIASNPQNLFCVLPLQPL